MRYYRLVLPTALAILIAVGSGPLIPGPASAAGSKPKPPPATTARVTFGIQPATKGALDRRPSYRYSVTPGGTLRDEVGVRNLSLVPITVAVYATDAINVNNGGFGLLPRAQRPRDVGAWATVGGSGSVTVKPRSFVVLPLSLKVPRNAQPGDHTGGIIVSATSRSKNAKGTNVVLDQRVGVRMFVRVSGPLRPALTVAPVSADYWGVLNPFGRGNTDISYRVTNTGNVNLGGRQRVSVQGLLGPDQPSVTISDAQLLLPGGSFDVTTSVPRTWPMVHERATVTIDPLIQKGDLVAGLTPGSGSASFWAVPWSLLVLLLILVAVLFVRRRLRGTSRAPARHGPGASAVPGHRSMHRLVGGFSPAVAVLLLAPVLAVVLAPAGAFADSAPYKDPNTAGGITLCSAQGKPITAGVTVGPIAATVVGGGAATPPYNGVGRSAALFAYQPRRGVDPGDWSGMGMTALSRYSNPLHPMVEILPRDFTLGNVVAAYPPLWDGFVQLRLYLRVPNQPEATYTYSATTLRVTGNTWRQLGPQAGAACNVGTAESVIRVLGLPTAAPTGKTSGAKGTRPGSAHPSLAAASSAKASRSGAAALASHPAQALVSGSSPANGGSTNPLIWAVSIAGFLAVAELLRRRFLGQRGGLHARR
jgi:hypothetical protein